VEDREGAQVALDQMRFALGAQALEDLGEDDISEGDGLAVLDPPSALGAPLKSSAELGFEESGEVSEWLKERDWKSRGRG
jgi:hypothetical protein